MDVQVVSSGSLRIDRVLRIGGVPRGYICEISGTSASGKTTVCQHIIAEAQKMQLACMIIDVDHCLDVNYAQRCGVNLDKLIIALPKTAEEAFDVMDTMIRSQAIDVVVFDSITQLIPQAEFETGEGRTEPGINQLLSQALRRLTKLLKKSNSLLVFTNSIQNQPEVIYHRLKEDPAKLALRYHAAVRLKLVPIGTILRDNQNVGERIEVTILKNRFAPFFDREELVIMYNDGIRKSGEIFDLGLEYSLIELRDRIYYYQDHALGKDQEAAIRTFETQTKIADQLIRDIRQKL